MTPELLRSPFQTSKSLIPSICQNLKSFYSTQPVCHLCLHRKHLDGQIQAACQTWFVRLRETECQTSADSRHSCRSETRCDKREPCRNVRKAFFWYYWRWSSSVNWLFVQWVVKGRQCTYRPNRRGSPRRGERWENANWDARSADEGNETGSWWVFLLKVVCSNVIDSR